MSLLDEPRPNIDPYPLSEYVAWAGRRNRLPILETLQELLPREGRTLELASGSGLHINFFAPHFPGVLFQPTDLDPDVFESIKAKRAALSNQNVADPFRLDLTDASTWPDPGQGLFNAIFVINIFQVAPVAIADGIFDLAKRVLQPDGLVAVYGPFKVGGEYTTPSNQAFDNEILAAKVPEWGLKDVHDLDRAARAHGLKLTQQIDRPANNFILVFKRG
jgi:cyclopropane fatty-acyl-phospholipid synthase-like methyltransferase